MRRDEGSFICEANVREVQGDQEKRQNHDYLREPEAQTETGLRKHRPLLSGDYARWEDLQQQAERQTGLRFPHFQRALTIYDEIRKPALARSHAPDTGLFRWNIVLNTGAGSARQHLFSHRLEEGACICGNEKVLT